MRDRVFVCLVGVMACVSVVVCALVGLLCGCACGCRCVIGCVSVWVGVVACAARMWVSVCGCVWCGVGVHRCEYGRACCVWVLVGWCGWLCERVWLCGGYGCVRCTCLCVNAMCARVRCVFSGLVCV